MATNYKLQKTNLLREAYRAYRYSDFYSLDDKYNNASVAKYRAWAYCRELCDKYNGSNLKVIGGNTFTFSAGFTFENDDGEKIFCYITPSSNRFYKVEG